MGFPALIQTEVAIGLGRRFPAVAHAVSCRHAGGFFECGCGSRTGNEYQVAEGSGGCESHRATAATDPAVLDMPTDEDREAYAAALPGRLEAAIAFVTKHQISANERSKRYYDKFRCPVTFVAGAMVLRMTHVLSSAAKQISAKLSLKWEGPFRIVSMLSDNVALLEDPETHEEMGTVHVCQLKPYHPLVVPGWPPPAPVRHRGRPPAAHTHNLRPWGLCFFWCQCCIWC